MTTCLVADCGWCPHGGGSVNMESLNIRPVGKSSKLSGKRKLNALIRHGANQTWCEELWWQRHSAKPSLGSGRGGYCLRHMKQWVCWNQLRWQANRCCAVVSTAFSSLRSSLPRRVCAYCFGVLSHVHSPHFIFYVQGFFPSKKVFLASALTLHPAIATYYSMCSLFSRKYDISGSICLFKHVHAEPH